MKKQINISLCGLEVIVKEELKGFTVRPVKDDGEDCTVCEKEEADFFTVYGDQIDGTQIALFDCEEEHQANGVKNLLENILNVYAGNTTKYPNGFTSWMETHHEVVTEITNALTADELEPEFKNKATRIREEQGTGGIYELAEELTDKFEQLNKGREWDGEFFDEINEFMRIELNKED